MQIKTSELKGSALDWAVATALGLPIIFDSIAHWVEVGPRHSKPIGNGWKSTGRPCGYSPSTYWEDCGPVIDRIGGGLHLKTWLESKPATQCEVHIHNLDGNWIEFGPTPQVATSRCFVAWKLGALVEIPDAVARNLGVTA